MTTEMNSIGKCIVAVKGLEAVLIAWLLHMLQHAVYCVSHVIQVYTSAVSQVQTYDVYIQVCVASSVAASVTACNLYHIQSW